MFMQTLRLMHIVDSLEFGGLERVVTDLAIEQRRQGHAVWVYSINQTDGFAPELRAAGVPVIVGHKTGTLDLKVLRGIRKLARNERLQLLHAHNFVPNYYAATSVLGLRAAPVLVGTSHDMGMRLAQRKLRFMYKSSLLRTARVAMVGQQVHDRFVDAGFVDRARAQTVLNGVAVERFEVTSDKRSAARRRLGVEETDLVIGAVGRFVALKNHALLIAAFARLAADMPSLKLVLIGYGALEDTLKEQVRACGLERRIVFTGQQPDVAALIPGFDIFAMPSRTEGLSIALLEAAATGLPIVATAVGGNVEIIQHGKTGLLVPSDDEAALTQALAQVAGDAALRKALGSAAKQWVQANASIQAMCNTYDGFYLQSLASEGRAV
jgi:glycosyltransferase involved in cell wall biosynthesis